MVESRNGPRHIHTTGLMLLAALLVLTVREITQPSAAFANPPAVQPELRGNQAEPQEISPEDAAAIQAGPVFTPMTVRPEIRNRTEVIEALMTNYPGGLRDAGIGGRVVVWFYISNTGQALHTRISEASGQAQLDQAALRVAAVYQFTPAMNRTNPVPVWIQLPVTFQVRN